MVLMQVDLIEGMLRIAVAMAEASLVPTIQAPSIVRMQVELRAPILGTIYVPIRVSPIGTILVTLIVPTLARDRILLIITIRSLNPPATVIDNY